MREERDYEIETKILECNNKIELLYSYFNYKGIPDEIVLKILYEFKGISTSSAIDLCNKPYDAWNYNLFNMGLNGDIYKFWKGARNSALNENWYKSSNNNGRSIRRRKHYKDSMKRTDNQEFCRSINEKVWNKWWYNKMNLTTLYNSGNSVIKSWVEDTHNPFDVGHRMANELLYAKYLQVRLTLFIHNWERYDSDIYTYAYGDLVRLNEMINEITSWGLELYGVKNGLDIGDKQEILENAIEMDWKAPKSNRDHTDTCDNCKGKFPLFFMKYKGNYDNRTRATNRFNLIYDSVEEEETSLCSYCSLEEEIDSFEDDRCLIRFDEL